MFDLDAEIFPNSSICGIFLRSSNKDFIQGILGPTFFNEFEHYMPNPKIVVYSFRNGIEVAMDIIAGKIQNISSGDRYRGSYKGVHVGMQVLNAFRTLPDLYYDEAEELILCKGVPGIAFNISEKDPPKDQIFHLTISNISVYAEDSMNRAGEFGNW